MAGLFKEFESGASTSSGSNSSGEVRYFQRQFVIVPVGGGFCIRNELIFVTSASSLQARTFMRQPAVTAAAATNVAVPGGSLQNRLQQHQASGASTVTVQPDDNTKLQMVQAMSAQSNMNLEWSKKYVNYLFFS